MPGSTTLGPGHGVDAIEHLDALRMMSLMKELHRMLTAPGPDRLTEAQVAALLERDGRHREGLSDWVERMARDLEKATA
ncbi:hypothetical protein PV371_30945 [Streptomyces sp. TX20-6-3]|uniref:hypothetical protein n=1 Tax=Streptomyces sp. TX20-6-3 TaxID=3028705 RepID=UPI0029B8FC3A|nr:hypothetical protein [Streptomyces sp. TX20-6-3]MDX2564044.1 hypothetical protein [Streptomyces sp. TX20-6-3]